MTLNDETERTRRNMKMTCKRCINSSGVDFLNSRFKTFHDVF